MKTTAWRPTAALRLVVLALGALAFSACSPASTPQGGSAGADALNVESREFAFTPSSLTVRSGQPAKLTLRNAGTVTHDFSVAQIPLSGDPEVHASEPAGHDMGAMMSQPALHVAVDAGADGAIEFTPSEPGTFEFYCSVPGHKEAGMTGTLIVEP